MTVDFLLLLFVEAYRAFSLLFLSPNVKTSSGFRTVRVNN